MKDNKKPIIIGKDSEIFKDIEAEVKKRQSGDIFLFPLDRQGIANGLGDSGRDGSRGGVKIHAIYVDKRWEVIEKMLNNGVITALEIKVK